MDYGTYGLNGGAFGELLQEARDPDSDVSRIREARAEIDFNDFCERNSYARKMQEDNARLRLKCGEAAPEEITGLCYCENDHCDKMWPVSCGVDGPQDADGRAILPCGHRLERLVASAEGFRFDNRDAEDYRWLRDHNRIDDYALDDLEEHKTDQVRSL